MVSAARPWESTMRSAASSSSSRVSGWSRRRAVTVGPRCGRAGRPARPHRGPTVTARRRDQPLTRDELLDAALRIVDSQGLAALTMRRLADALGVEAMSLYHHVPTNDALLEWTVERMRSEMRLPDPLPEDWVDLMAAIFGEDAAVLAEDRRH